MIVLDANVLIYAFRAELPQHVRVRGWLDVARSLEPLLLHPLAAAAFLRLTTKPLGPLPAAPVGQAVAFLKAIVPQAPAAPMGEHPAHLATLLRLAEGLGLAGDRINDLWLAAFALTHGLGLASTDRGFSRIPGLRWVHPLEV
jgi:hypothetical protein